jgi:hypothetical protein
MHTYISPYSGAWSEQVDDSGDLNDIVDDIVAQSIQQEVDEEEEEGQFLREPLLRISHHEALQALHVLRRYEEENKLSSGDFLRALRQFERDLGARYTGSLSQSRIDQFVIHSS